MDTRIVIKFKHRLEASEMVIQERKLMRWLKDNDYLSPLIVGSLMFNELTVSWGWNDRLQPYENAALVIPLRNTIREFFGPLVETE